jgi:hypothetical protein
LHVQQSRRTDVAAFNERIVTQAIPNAHGLAAWQALLRAHATPMRQLATDLVEEVGPTLGDFDVLAQLAQAGGELSQERTGRPGLQEARAEHRTWRGASAHPRRTRSCRA